MSDGVRVRVGVMTRVSENVATCEFEPLLDIVNSLVALFDTEAVRRKVAVTVRMRVCDRVRGDID